MTRYNGSSLFRSSPWSPVPCVVGVMMMALVASAGAVTVDPNLPDQTLAEALAPVVHFHPAEASFPISYEAFMLHSTLKDANHNIIASGLGSVAQLIAASKSSTDYLDLDNNYRGGDLVNAPLYARVVSNGTYKEVVYWAQYAYNDCQIFRGKFYNTWYTSSKTVNFEWCNFGRHEKDTENMTVRLNAQTGEVIGAFLSSHGDQKWYGASSLSWSNGTHANVYVALNTHGFWPSKATTTTGTVLDSNVSWLFSAYAVRMAWLKTVDTTTTDDLIGFGNTAYTVWETRDRIALINPGDPITGYLGLWGETLDNSNVLDPTGDVPNVSDGNLEDLGQAAMNLGYLKAYETAHSGPGAWTRPWYDGNF